MPWPALLYATFDIYFASCFHLIFTTFYAIISFRLLFFAYIIAILYLIAFPFDFFFRYIFFSLRHTLFITFD